MKQGFVYIMSNKIRTTLYVGVTGNLERRVLEHKAGCGSLFTNRYKLHDLLYFELIKGMQNAINREKQLKKWHKEWKWNLIRKKNPQLRDLAKDWYTPDDIEEMKRDPETSSA